MMATVGRSLSLTRRGNDGDGYVQTSDPDGFDRVPGVHASCRAGLGCRRLDRYAAPYENSVLAAHSGLGAHGAPARERRGRTGAPQATEPGSGAAPRSSCWVLFGAALKSMDEGR